MNMSRFREGSRRNTATENEMIRSEESLFALPYYEAHPDHFQTPLITHYVETPLHIWHPQQYNCMGVSKQRAVQRREKGPGKFDGSTDWNEFIIQLESVSHWNEWNQDDMAQQLVMLLWGQARQIIGHDLTIRQLNDYNALKRALMQRFDSPERELSYRYEFQNRRKMKSETISEFGNVLRRLASHAYQGLSSFSLEVCIVDQFIKGIGNFAATKHIQYKRPKNLDEAMSYAIEFDAVEGPVRSATYTNPQEKLSTVDKTNQCSLRRISNVAKITIDRTEIEIIALAANTIL